MRSMNAGQPGPRRSSQRRLRDAASRLTTPKNGEGRTIYLIEDPEIEAIDAIGLFERWTRICGIRPGDSPLFPAPRSGGRLNSSRASCARRREGIVGAGPNSTIRPCSLHHTEARSRCDRLACRR